MRRAGGDLLASQQGPDKEATLDIIAQRIKRLSSIELNLRSNRSHPGAVVHI